jgi:hypothetical protein
VAAAWFTGEAQGDQPELLQLLRLDARLGRVRRVRRVRRHRHLEGAPWTDPVSGSSPGVRLPGPASLLGTAAGNVRLVATPGTLPHCLKGVGEVPPLAAPGTSPSTSRTRTCARHAESTHRTPLPDGRTLPAAALASEQLEAESRSSPWPDGSAGSWSAGTGTGCRPLHADDRPERPRLRHRPTARRGHPGVGFRTTALATPLGRATAAREASGSRRRRRLSLTAQGPERGVQAPPRLISARSTGCSP